MTAGIKASNVIVTRKYFLIHGFDI